MAFVLTNRIAASSGTGGIDNALASESFTPTANSRLFVFAGAFSNNHSGARNWTITNSAGLTFTALDQSATFQHNGYGGNYTTDAKAWYVDVGGSPSAMTLSVDPGGAANDAYFVSFVAFDVTGFDAVTPFAQASVDTGANFPSTGNSHAGTITLGGSPANGNLVVGMFAVSAEATAAASTPTGYTAIVSNDQQYVHIGAFYRTDTTTPTITSTDLGNTVGAWAGIGFEMKAPGGAAPNAGPLVNANRLKSMFGALVN